MPGASRRGTIQFLFNENAIRPEKRGVMLKYWNDLFGPTDFSRLTSPLARKRFRLLSDFADCLEDRRLKSGLLNVIRFGQYYTPAIQSNDSLLEFALSNYRLGREFERDMHTGYFNNRYAVSVEPHYPYNQQESLWMMALSDLSLEGNPIIARIGVNFHREGNQIVASVPLIQGSPGKKDALDQFLKNMRPAALSRPWPVFLLTILQHYSKKARIGVIRGIPDERQSFFKRELFRSGKSQAHSGEHHEQYSLYSTTLREMGFHAPVKNRVYFELPMQDVRIRPGVMTRLQEAFVPLKHRVAPSLKKKRSGRRMPLFKKRNTTLIRKNAGRGHRPS